MISRVDETSPTANRALGYSMREIFFNLYMYKSHHGRLPSDQAGGSNRHLRNIALLIFFSVIAGDLAIRTTDVANNNYYYYIFIFLLTYAAIAFYRWTFSRTLLAAPDLLSADRRPPVVYLRSFRDDEMTMRAGVSGWGRIHAMRFRVLGWRLNLEEELADLFSEYGPFIAIQRKGERLKTLGASRAFIDDKEWQVVAADWMTEAGLIVVMTGDSAGLQWEIKWLEENGLLRKTVFLFPPSYGILLGRLLRMNEKRRLAWAALTGALGLKNAAGYTKLPANTLAACITENGTMTLVSRKSFLWFEPAREEYAKAIKIAAFASLCLNSRGEAAYSIEMLNGIKLPNDIE